MSPKRIATAPPWQTGVLAGLLCAALYFSRPSGIVVVFAVALHFAFNTPRRGKRWPLAIVLFGLIVGAALIAHGKLIDRAWGFETITTSGHRISGLTHSLMRCHLICMDITQGMFGGWGLPWPAPREFIAGHFGEIVAKIGGHALAYTEVLLDTNALGLLSPLLALVAVSAFTTWRGWSLLWLLALGHWTAAVLTWATTDTLRLALPATVCLLPLCVGAGAELIRGAGERRRQFAFAAGLLVMSQMVLGGVGMVMKSQQIGLNSFPAVERPVPLPISYSEQWAVCSDSPFRLAYRSDLACVIFPFDLPERAAERPELWRQFLGNQRVRHFAVQGESTLESLQPLVDAGLLQQLQWPDPEFLWFEVTGAAAP